MGKVWIVGLDGATLDLIVPWVEQGELPTLARIMREGTVGQLTTVIPPMTGPAWTSFATGKNPGKHGIVDFVQRRAGSYDIVPVNARSRWAQALSTPEHPVKSYFVRVNLKDVEDPRQRTFLNQVPTSFRLTDEQVDKLIEAGGELLRNNPEFRRLMADVESTP